MNMEPSKQEHTLCIYRFSAIYATLYDITRQLIIGLMYELKSRDAKITEVNNCVSIHSLFQ